MKTQIKSVKSIGLPLLYDLCVRQERLCGICSAPPAPLRPPRPLRPSRGTLDSLMLLPFHPGGPEYISGNIRGESDESLAGNDATERCEGLLSFLEVHPGGCGWGEGAVWLLAASSSPTRGRQRVSAHGRTMAPVPR